MARTYKDRIKRIQRNFLNLEDEYDNLKPDERIKVDNWFKQEPGWWHNLHSTRPRRQKERAIISKISLDINEFVWPLDKKPHLYYW